MLNTNKPFMETVKQELLIFRIAFSLTVITLAILFLSPSLTDSLAEVILRGIIAFITTLGGSFVMASMSFYPVEAILMGRQLWVAWRGTVIQCSNSYETFETFLEIHSKNKKDFIFFSSGVVVAKHKNDAILLKLLMGC